MEWNGNWNSNQEKLVIFELNDQNRNRNHKCATGTRMEMIDQKKIMIRTQSEQLTWGLTIFHVDHNWHVPDP